MDVPTVTLIVLVVQAVIYGFMLRRMREANESTRIAADAAKEGAKAAAQANLDLREFNKTTQRAIVLVDNVKAEVLDADTGGRLIPDTLIVFTLKNFGQIAANTVELTGKLLGPGTLPIAKTPPTDIAPQGSNSWVTQSIGKIADDEAIRKIHARTTWLEYKIVVTYADAFGTYRYHCDGVYEPALKRFLIISSKTE